MPDSAFCLLSVRIAKKRNNGYGTVRNIKVVSIDSFKHTEVANKVDYIKTKLRVYCKHGFGLHMRESFVCIFR